MRNETRAAFDAYTAALARNNGVSSATVKFAVTPTVQQKLETKIQESSEFLSRINIFPVTEQSGAKLGLGVSGPIAGRTDTSGNGTRQTRDVTTLDGDTYECKQTNYDTHIRYAKLDTWAKFPDFQARCRDVVVRQSALDRIMIGFNGTSVAATTDLAGNPLLQDVNIGWLQQIRTKAPARRIFQGDLTKGGVANKIRCGPGGDYAHLDGCVYDATTLLAPWAQQATNLVVIVSRDLLHDKYLPIINRDQPPSEQIKAADIIKATKTIGGLPAYVVPGMPPKTMLITTFDNLSIYVQEGGRRSHVKDVPERDRIEQYESSNDAYVVESYEYVALIENVETGDYT